MFEIAKLLWDVVMIRDASRRGLLNWRVWAVSIAFVVFLYGTGVPVGIFWDKYPQYGPLFAGVLVLDGVVFVAFVIWAWRWQAQTAARRAKGQVGGK